MREFTGYLLNFQKDKATQLILDKIEETDLLAISIINFFFKIIYDCTKMFQFRHTYYIIIDIDYLLIFFMRGELLWITLLILHDGSLQ